MMTIIVLSYKTNVLNTNQICIEHFILFNCNQVRQNASQSVQSMSVRWKCIKCETSNSHMVKRCKICLHKPDNFLSLCLESIELKQDSLFSGFLRLIIPNNNKPLDIIDLCFKFYKVYLANDTNPKSSESQQLDKIWKMADTFYWNDENFIAYNVFNMMCPTHNSFSLIVKF